MSKTNFRIIKPEDIKKGEEIEYKKILYFQLLDVGNRLSNIKAYRSLTDRKLSLEDAICTIDSLESMIWPYISKEAKAKIKALDNTHNPPVLEADKTQPGKYNTERFRMVNLVKWLEVMEAKAHAKLRILIEQLDDMGVLLEAVYEEKPDDIL